MLLINKKIWIMINVQRCLYQFPGIELINFDIGELLNV